VGVLAGAGARTGMNTLSRTLAWPGPDKPVALAWTCQTWGEPIRSRATVAAYSQSDGLERAGSSSGLHCH